MNILPYNREKAVAYAHQWAFARNPAYYDFSGLGGDCTNFASQCVFAGAPVMNLTKDTGWYYHSTHDRPASWTGVEFFHRFMTQNKNGPGPFMKEVSIHEVEPGDVIQLRFKKHVHFSHCPVVTAVGPEPNPANILVAAHTIDSDDRPLDTYAYEQLRPLKVMGYRMP